MKDKKLEYNEVSFIKLVTVGGINPNNPISEESKQQQLEELNRCLNEYPKGRILALDRTIGRFMVGEHEFTMEKVTYHVGFARKPYWL